MSKEMLEAFDTLEKTKGIKKEVIVDAIKAALVAAYKKNYNQAQNVEVDFDERTGNFKVMAVKTVVDEVQDDRLEVSLKDALAINGAYEVGDEIRFEVTPKNFGRISAQTAKQVIMQRLREAKETILLMSILNMKMNSLQELLNVETIVLSMLKLVMLKQLCQLMIKCQMRPTILKTRYVCL